MDPAFALRLEAAEKQIAATHLRAVYAEKRLEVEKRLHKTASDALILQITKQMVEVASGSATLLPQKRKQELSENSDGPAKKSKQAIVVCVECFKSKLHKRCDSDSPC
ncbi:unnamed protein product [Alternaria burnsii]|nr:unnamed protein product [Alternaria burnsii]